MSGVVNQPSAAPVRKVAAGGIAGAIVTVLVWVLSQYANVQVPDGVAAAVTTIIVFVVAYLVPASATDVGA